MTEALANNKEVQRLESAMQARGLEARAARSEWLPQIDLIAQYGLFAKFNNYEDYFRTFQAAQRADRGIDPVSGVCGQGREGEGLAGGS